MSNYITLIDFGSTFTKGVVIDADKVEIAAQDKTPSTVETDVRDGLNKLFASLGNQLSPEIIEKSKKRACSSAAGGLRMVIIGLIPELTLEAGRKAAYNSGAKIVGSFAGELTPKDMQALIASKPDIILLGGGTDGGNKKVIMYNSQQLANQKLNVPIIVAGNKEVSYRVKDQLEQAGCISLLADNVMPEIGKINIEPARDTIRKLFIERIIIAKGIAGVKDEVNLLMPTPDAVLRAVKIIGEGTKKEEGIGELLVVDVGGATTDVYTVGAGAPSEAKINLKNLLPEPFVKRTVEGDLGLRHNAATILDTAGEERLTELAGLPESERDFVANYCRTVKPAFVSKIGTKEYAVDLALVKGAVEIAVERHVGFLESTYLPGIGETFFQTGKDMRNAKYVIGTGGPIIDIPEAKEILQMATWQVNKPFSLRPKQPVFVKDTRYLLYAIGLLSDEYPDIAFQLVKKYEEVL